MRYGDGIAEESVAGHDDDLLDQGLDEGSALGRFALVEEVPHVLGVGRDRVHVVEDLPALGEHRSGILRRIIQALLPVLELLDVERGVGHDSVGRCDVAPYAPQLPLHIRKLILNGPKPLALLSGHSAHLLVHHLEQLADVALGEDVGANLGDDKLLEAASVERGSLAGVLAELDVRLADVVGVLAALGEPADERRLARLALEQAAEQVGASDSAGVAELGRAGAQVPPDALELRPGDDGGKRLLHPHRFGVVLGVRAPDQLPCFLIDTKNCGTRGRWTWVEVSKGPASRFRPHGMF